MVALSVLMMGLVAIFALLTRSLAASRVVSDSYIATYLAAEGIEVVKNILDHNQLVCSSSPSCTTPWNDGLGSLNGQEVYLDYTSLVVGTDPNAPPRGNLGISQSGFYANNNPLNPVKFRRIVSTRLIGSDEVKVNSTVTWHVGGFGLGVPVTQQVNLEDHFFKP